MRKTALITGSSKGLGEELAVIFAKNNYNLIIHGRNETDLLRVKERLSALGAYSDIVIGDIRDSKTLDELQAKAKERDIDILVNNAGIGLKMPLEQINDSQIDELLETNLLSVIKLTRRIYGLLTEKGRGTIININSLSGLENQDLRSIYCASKWGLRGFTNTLRLEAEKNNVAVIGVYPSRTKTKPKFTYGMEPEYVAQKIFDAYKNSLSEIILDERPEEYKK